MIQFFQRGLMQMKGKDGICLFTTVETGDFCISTLAFKHFMFESGPVTQRHIIVFKRKEF